MTQMINYIGLRFNIDPNQIIDGDDDDDDGDDDDDDDGCSLN